MYISVYVNIYIHIYGLILPYVVNATKRLARIDIADVVTGLVGEQELRNIMTIVLPTLYQCSKNNNHY